MDFRLSRQQLQNLAYWRLLALLARVSHALTICLNYGLHFKWPKEIQELERQYACTRTRRNFYLLYNEVTEIQMCFRNRTQ